MTREKFPGVCEGYRQLQRALDEGSAITEKMRCDAVEHARVCTQCGLDVRIEDALNFRGEELVDPLDQLARRRAIHAAVERASDTASLAGVSGLAPFLSAVPDRRPASRVGWGLAVGVVAVLFAVVWFVADFGSHDIALQRGQSTEQDELARVSLAASGARINGAAAHVDLDLRAGSELVVEQGEVFVRLNEATIMRAESGTQITLERLSKRAVEVRLGKGRALFEVEPGHRDLSVDVITPRGRAHVVGTAFEVAGEGDHFAISVFRGKVEVRDRVGVRLLGAGVQLTFGEPGTRALETPAPIEEALLVAKTLLAPETVPLEITSTPAGAEVFIDGASVGRTPVSTLVEPTPRVLQLSLPGYTSVHEVVQPAPNKRYDRHYQLAAARRDVTSRASTLAAAPHEAPATAEPAESAEPHAGTGPAAAAPNGRAPRSHPRASATQPRGDAQDTPVVADPVAALLARARAARAEKAWQRAADAYEELASGYAGRPEAASALVALGTLRLERLDDAVGALGAFERYLDMAASGALAEEARWGRIRALRSLGRDDEERAALKAFTVRYPASWRVEDAKARLELLAP